MNCQSLWFLILTWFNIAAIIIDLLVNDIRWQPSFILMVIALIYWGYMFFLEMHNSGQSSPASEGLINNANTNFMADTLFRYLFVIVIGNTFFSYYYRITINYRYSPYGRGDIYRMFKTIMYYFVIWYSYSVLPFACIVDFCCRKRNRTPNPKYDLIITLLFGVILGLLQDKYYYYHSMGLNIVSMGVTYLIYDYILFKMNGGQNYTICPQNTV